MFSAASRQTEQRMNRVSPSFHSLDCRSNVRGVEATVKFATAAPEGVNRSSGSAVRLPTMVMMVSPAMGGGLLLQSFRRCAARTRSSGAGAHELGPHDRLVEAELAVQLLGRRRL